MTDSPNKGYNLQATGTNDGTWGVVVNAILTIIDLNLGGRNNKSVAGSSNITLSADEAKPIYQYYTGVLTGNIDVRFPAAAGGFYVVKNSTTGSFTITVKPLGGTGVVVPQGGVWVIFIDPDTTSAITLKALVLDIENQGPITGGAEVTSKSLGTVSSGTLTLDMADRQQQHYTNNGAHTLAPGSVSGSCLVDILNGASAGAITTSGWTYVSGDAFATTDTYKYRCSCVVGSNGSTLTVQKMQA